MGTRGAYGYILDGKTVATYNHFDSYPEHLGHEVIAATRKALKRGVASIRQALTQTKVIDTDVPPTPDQIDACHKAKLVDLSVSSQEDTDWYCLLRNAQGDVDGLLSGRIPYISNSKDFLQDSLFCEYAYLLNLDDNTLEVYAGFNQDWSAPGRYAYLAEKTKTYENGETVPNEYAGVRLALTIPFDKLSGKDSTKRWVARMKKACRDDSGS